MNQSHRNNPVPNQNMRANQELPWTCNARPRTTAPSQNELSTACGRWPMALAQPELLSASECKSCSHVGQPPRSPQLPACSMSSAGPPKAAHARLCLIKSHRKIGTSKISALPQEHEPAVWALNDPGYREQKTRPGSQPTHAAVVALQHELLRTWICVVASFPHPSRSYFEILEPLSRTPCSDSWLLSVQGCDARTAPRASPPDAPGASVTWNDPSASPEVRGAGIHCVTWSAARTFRPMYGFFAATVVWFPHSPVQKRRLSRL